LPGRKLGSQSIKIKFRQRFLSPSEIPQSAIQNRPRPDKVPLRLVMECHRQLNHSLQMPSKPTLAPRFPPRIFQSLMSLKKAPLIKEHQSEPERAPKIALRSSRGSHANLLCTVFSIFNDLNYT
jgi:hypothetical protein